MKQPYNYDPFAFPYREKDEKREMICFVLFIVAIASIFVCGIIKTNRELVKYSLENGEIKREVIATDLGTNCEVLRTKLKDEKNLFCEDVKK